MTTTSVQQLGYIGLNVSRPDDWRALASDILGLEETGEGPDGSVYFTNDAYQRRVLLHQSDRSDIAYAGWEVFTPTDLQKITDQLRDAGATVSTGTPADKKSRGVLDLVRFIDPEGNVGEVFYGPIVVDDLAVSRTLRDRFVTAALGMGHFSLAVRDIDRFVEFYSAALGLQLSGARRDIPIGEGRVTHVATLRCNARQHSLSLVQLERPQHLLHIGLEVRELDDLGIAMEKADKLGLIGIPLGRHAADHMLSFYLNAPGGLQIEYGWGGRLLHPKSRVEQYITGPSIWGHKGLV